MVTLLSVESPNMHCLQMKGSRPPDWAQFSRPWEQFGIFGRNNARINRTKGTECKKETSNQIVRKRNGQTRRESRYSIIDNQSNDRGRGDWFFDPKVHTLGLVSASHLEGGYSGRNPRTGSSNDNRGGISNNRSRLDRLDRLDRATTTFGFLQLALLVSRASVTANCCCIRCPRGDCNPCKESE